MANISNQAFQDNLLLAYTTARDLTIQARKAGFNTEISCSIQPEEGMVFFYIHGLDNEACRCFVRGINNSSGKDFLARIEAFKAYWSGQIGNSEAIKEAKIAELKRQIAELEG